MHGLFAGKQGVAILVMALIVVGGIIVLAGAVVTLKPKVSSVGLDMTYFYKDGSKQTFKSERGTLSLLKSSALTVYDTGGQIVEKIEYQPWVQVIYEGSANKWSYVVSLTVKTRAITGLPSPNTQFFNTTWSSTTPPVSTSYYNIATFTQTASDLEKRSQTYEGEHEIIGLLTVKIIIENTSANAKVEGSKSSETVLGKVKINHTTSLLPLKITSITVGTATNIIKMQGTQYDCSFIGGC